MRRYWPVLVALVLGVGLWALLGGRDVVETITGGGAEHEESLAPGELPLRGIARDPEAARREREAERPPAPEPEAAPREEVEYLTGVVLDETTGGALAGATVWLQSHVEPCPRLPDEGAAWWRPVLTAGPLSGTEAPFPFPTASTDGEGRFRFRAFRESVPPSGTVDVFASAAGHVLGVACAPAVPGEATLRLATSLRMRCEVVDPDGRPVKDAVVRARPGPSTPATPGHGAAAVTGDRGIAELDGLLPGDVMLEADHPAFVLAKSGPYEPQRDAYVTIALTPAFRATLKVRSDDGRPLKNVTLRWRTDGQPPRGELLLLRCRPVPTKAEAGAELECDPVKVPCDRKTVVLEVKADGYGTWTSPEEPLPPGGGEKTFDVTLSGDAGVGSIRVILEDESGRPMRWDESKASVLAVVRTDGPPASSGYVLEGGEDLRFPSMPQGAYQVHLRSPAFAPAQADAVAVPGREVEVRVRTRPPARLRVRFTASEPLVVRFRLLQGGRVVQAVPVDAPGATGEEEQQPVYSAAEGGLLLSGLGGGAYSIEVLNADWVAPPTTVSLREGDTEEVEIDVKKR